MSVASRIRGLDRTLYPLVDKAHLLPDPSSTPMLDWNSVKKRVSKTRKLELIDCRLVDELLAVQDKRTFSELSEGVWPPRSSTDLALRRSRLLDWVLVFKQTGRADILRRVLCGTRSGWDLIFVTNVVVATYVFGESWWQRWHWLGAFDADLVHFVEVAKEVHNIAKTTGIRDKDWTYYVETSGLSGYRNLPYEGFDVLAEAASLAEGGDVHDYFGYTWDELCERFLPMSFKPVKYVPFKDWVLEGEWLTGGASSVGRVEFEVDGKPDHVKARKNVVLDVVDVEELARAAEMSELQVNTTVIKSELSKVRLAVAGDINTYLQMTWITRLLGGAYYEWPGNTSEEGFEAQTIRLSRMLELCSRMYGLPYDYAGFDHQPTQDELLGIVAHLCRHARRNVPPEYYDEFDSIVARVVAGWKTAVLKTTFEGVLHIMRVTGGLMSGLRWTSIVGNAFNSVATGLCLLLLEAWGIDTDQIERYIRGDDSAVFVPNWPTGAAMNVAYDGMGVKGGVGKFSLQIGKMEFLRVWFDTRCRGYPCRSVPGLTQRKPWSSDPWTEDMVLRALYEGLRTTKRRLNGDFSHLDDAWDVLKRVWCRNHNLPVDVVATPTWNGGLGIEPMPFGWLYKVDPPIPKLDIGDSIKITNLNGWRRDKTMAYADEKYGIDASPFIDDLVQSEVSSTLTADSVPAFARHARQAWLKRVRSAGCRVQKSRLDAPTLVLPLPASEYRADNITSLMLRLKALAPLYGICPELATAKADYVRFQSELPFRQWLRSYFPKAYTWMSVFHKSWHMSEVIDYLVGSLTFAPTIIHPALVGLVTLTAAGLLQPKKHTVRGASLVVAHQAELLIAQTQISQIVYWW